MEKKLILTLWRGGLHVASCFFLTWCEDCSKKIILSRTTLFLLLPFPFACREPKKKYAWNLYRENFFASTRCALLLLASAIFFQLASATYLPFCILSTPYTFHILLFLQSGRLNAPFRSCLPVLTKKTGGLSLTCVDETHAFPSSASYSSPWYTRLFLSSGILPILLSFRHRSASSSYLLLRTLLAVNRLWAQGPRLGIWAGTPPLSTLPNSPIDPLGGVDADRGRCTISCCHGRQLYPGVSRALRATPNVP